MRSGTAGPKRFFSGSAMGQVRSPEYAAHLPGCDVNKKSVTVTLDAGLFDQFAEFGEFAF